MSYAYLRGLGKIPPTWEGGTLTTIFMGAETIYFCGEEMSGSVNQGGVSYGVGPTYWVGQCFSKDHGGLKLQYKPFVDCGYTVIEWLYNDGWKGRLRVPQGIDVYTFSKQSTLFKHPNSYGGIYEEFAPGDPNANYIFYANCDAPTTSCPQGMVTVWKHPKGAYVKCGLPCKPWEFQDSIIPLPKQPPHYKCSPKPCPPGSGKVRDQAGNCVCPPSKTTWKIPGPIKAYKCLDPCQQDQVRNAQGACVCQPTFLPVPIPGTNITQCVCPAGQMRVRQGGPIKQYRCRTPGTFDPSKNWK